eukprot:COSAG02_NODE_38753_length_425_cov_1.055215_1_plen_26_part_01
MGIGYESVRPKQKVVVPLDRRTVRGR